MVKKKNKQSSALERSVGQPQQADSLSIENGVSANGAENIGVLPEQDVSPDSGLVKWQMFIKVVHAHIDPVLASMLFETDFVKFDQAKKIIHLVTLKKFTMFQDLFIEQRQNYQEYLDRIFGFKTILVVEFIKISEKKKMDEQKKEAPGSVAQVHSGQVTSPNEAGSTESRRQTTGYKPYDRTASSRNVSERSVSVSVSRNEKNIDITDEKKWKLTHKLLEHFGGTVREIIKDSNEFDA
jgi:hypothetical protein